jgi:hydroxymethylpyrimidine/phosphomethylpyrimidine kinase
MTSTPPVVLAIAATDSGGGAGLAADLATFASLGVHGTLVVTAVTAQDTTAVTAIHVVPLQVVSEQLDAVLGDLLPAVVKTGMLGSAEAVRLVADRCGALPLVVDPVLRATTGAVLGDASVVTAYREHLLPVAAVITPNADEARILLGLAPDDTTPARDLAVDLAALGPAVVLTGGPLPETGRAVPCTDWLALPGSREPVPIQHPAVATSNDHGTGCTFASALAAHLAQGLDLPTAARRAAAHVTTQLERSSTWDLGAGRGPIAHTHPRQSDSGQALEESYA